MNTSMFRLAGAALSLALSLWIAAAGPARAQIPSVGGDLTPYLVGEFSFLRPLADNNVTAIENRYTIHNPTTKKLRFLAAPFDFSGEHADILGILMTCWTGELAPNGRSFLAIAALPGFLPVDIGTFKIVALDGLGRPEAGIVGFQERFIYKGDGPLGLKNVVAGSRSNLASVPDVALRNGELERIKEVCGEGDVITDLTSSREAESEDGSVRIRTGGGVIRRPAQ